MQNNLPIKRIGVYPGTFDPITSGHMDIIRTALKLVDHLIIAVSESKSKGPIFTVEERVDMVQHTIKDLPNAEAVTVEGFQGLLVDFAKARQAAILIRGLRAVSDFEYEFQMSCMNSRLAPGIETIFLPASEHTHFIASRFVKEIARLDGDITDMVSPYVLTKLQQKFI